MDEEGTPRSYEHYRCPVCDESYYTLEVLSAHMAANGHGRFGTVEFIRDQRIEAASAYLGCQSVDFTDCMDDAPQYGVPVTPVLERPVRETEYRAEAAPHTFVPERLPAIAAMQPAAQAAMSRTSDAPYRFSPPTTSSQPASSVPPTPYLLQLCQCVPCGIMFGSPDELDTHYRVSTAHPSCPLCGNGQEHQDALFQVRYRMQIYHAPWIAHVVSSIAASCTEWMYASAGRSSPRATCPRTTRLRPATRSARDAAAGSRIGSR